VYSDSARVVIERLVRARPGESDFHYDLGFIYAGLGRLQDPTREHARYAELRRAHADTLWLRPDGGNDWAGMWLLLADPTRRSTRSRWCWPTPPIRSPPGPHCG